MRTSEKVAVVTGASRNIGRAVARRLAADGATVACCYTSDVDGVGQTVETIKAEGGTASSYRLDLTSVADIRDVFARIADELGAPAILVNNAAIRPVARIAEIEPDDFDSVVAVNLRGPFFCAQAVLPAMRAAGWGRIVNLSGASAYVGGIGRAHVIATKLGIVGLTRALAAETAIWQITVNAVVPGVIDTPRAPGDPLGDHAAQAAKIPVGRVGKPAEIAGAVAYLCSDDAAYVTGQELFVSGGRPGLARHSGSEY
jgi:3-oxoacyl-[acyl-carrier protein] reductase